MARETLAVYKALHRDKLVQGFIVEEKYKTGDLLSGLPVYSPDFLSKFGTNFILIAGIGSPKKKRWILKLETSGVKFDKLIHPSSIVDPLTDLDIGCIICQTVVLTTNIKIGKHSIVNIGTTINHDSHIGNFCFVGPGAHIAGNVHIADGSWLGIGAIVKEKIKIGKNCFIGAGAVVVNDIPDNHLAIGIPAKPVKKLGESDWDKLI